MLRAEERHANSLYIYRTRFDVVQLSNNAVCDIVWSYSMTGKKISVTMTQYHRKAKSTQPLGWNGLIFPLCSQLHTTQYTMPETKAFPRGYRHCS